jgi:hypothetical protein
MKIKKILLLSSLLLALAFPALALSPSVFKVNQGGTGLSSISNGALLYGSSTNEILNTLPTGTTGYVLQTNNGYPQWVSTSSLGIISGGGVWGQITGNIANQSDLQSALNSKLSTTTAASTYYLQTNPASYITLAALSPYLTTSTASSTYYRISNPAGYITSTALIPYLTTSTAALIYQPIGSYISTTTGNWIGTWQSKNSSDFLASSTQYVATSTGNWQGTWQNATSGTYYLASNPNHYISTSTNLTVANFATSSVSQWTNDAGYVSGTPWTLLGYWYSGSHPTTTSAYGLPDYPTTLPASDVYAWAKASVKPSYSFAELTSHPTTVSGYGITDTPWTGMGYLINSNNLSDVASTTVARTNLGCYADSNPSSYISGVIADSPLSGSGTSGSHLVFTNPGYILNISGQDLSTASNSTSKFITLNSLSAGTGISYATSTGVITNTAPDKVVSIATTTGISVSGSYPNFTIGNSSPASGLTFSTGLTNIGRTITNNLSTGLSGGQTIYGDTAASGNLTLSSTINATKGKILFGTSAYDEVNNRLGIGTTNPSQLLTVGDNNQFTVSSVGALVSQSATIGASTVIPVVVSCSGCNTNPAGTYSYKGQYGGYNYYQRGTDSWYIWYQSATYWTISTVLGSGAGGQWYYGSSATTPPSSLLGPWLYNNGYTGTLNTAAGSAPLVIIDTAGDLTMGGQLASTGAGNSYILGNVGIGTTAPTTPLYISSSSQSAVLLTLNNGGYTYTFNRNSSTGFLDILGSQGNPYSGITTGTGNFTSALKLNGNPVLTSDPVYFQVNNATNTDGGSIGLNSATAYIRMGDFTGGYYYTIQRNSSSGMLQFSGSQNGYIGYIFDTKIGIGLTAGLTPTYALSFGGQSAQAIWMERNTTANTAGLGLTIQAGGATSAATDKNGGAMVLAPGLSTGMGFSSVRLQSLSRAASTGTADNTMEDRIIVPSVKNLTNTGAIGLFDVSLPTLATAGGIVDYTITATDGTNMHSISGRVLYDVVNKGGVYTSQITPTVNTVATSNIGGTNVPVFTIVTGTNKFTVTVTDTDSLTTTVEQIRYTICNNSGSTITQL